MNDKTTSNGWRMYLKRNRGLLLIGLILMAFGIWWDFQWISINPPPTLYIINLLPGISFLFGWLVISSSPKRNWISIGAIVLIGFALIYCSYIANIGIGAIISATTPITDISEYAEVRSQLGDHELFNHFPNAIPNNATNVRFEYLPKFMQGGSHFQLRLRLPQNEIYELLDKYRSDAKYIYLGSDEADMEESVPTTYFFTSDNGDLYFSEDYEIIVLDAQPGGSHDFQWNHGFSYGVVINSIKSEIIYWSEYW